MFDSPPMSRWTSLAGSVFCSWLKRLVSDNTNDYRCPLGRPVRRGTWHSRGGVPRSPFGRPALSVLWLLLARPAGSRRLPRFAEVRRSFGLGTPRAEMSRCVVFPTQGSCRWGLSFRSLVGGFDFGGSLCHLFQQVAQPVHLISQ